MIIGEILARNARMYGAEIALVEREPERERRTGHDTAGCHAPVDGGEQEHNGATTGGKNRPSQ